MGRLGFAVVMFIGALAVGHEGAHPVTAQTPESRVDCIPYNPETLTLTDEGPAGWLLARADGARFRQFDNRADAEAGLAVAKAHTALCYIGRGNTRPNHHDYVMEFWR